MPLRDIVVIGASAGGVEALSKLVRALPGDLPAAVLVVVHFPSDTPSTLPRILSRAGSLPAIHAVDGQPIQQGTIYVAPPGRHTMVEAGYVRVTHGPRENRCRPSIDPLFRSAALAYGTRVIGVILTGSLDDGTAGLSAIARRGGMTIVQDPSDAIFPGMPRSALNNVDVDRCLPLEEIPDAITAAIRERADEQPGGNVTLDRDELEHNVEIVTLEHDAIAGDNRPGQPSRFGCPECGGVLWEQPDDHPLRFRCRVGHAYSAESLLAAQRDGYEVALWTAFRALEEKRELTERLILRARERGLESVMARFEEQRDATQRAAEVIRELLATGAENPAALMDSVHNDSTGDPQTGSG